MKRLAMAIALTCLLSISVIGGDMHGTDIPAPTPTPLGMRLESSHLMASMPGESYIDQQQPTLADALDALLSVFGLVF
ncbi:MAG TPA: hypothetical protein VNO50_02265 [Pyrinomonadaceae bacterium]|nr:hypothetical protein [Pyrinomonadaceae bacterium]